jgi:hypothetical protein
LSRTPTNRPTVAELEAPFKSALRANSTGEAPSVAQPAVRKIIVPPPTSHRKRNLSLAAAASLLVGVGGWMSFSGEPQSNPRATLAAAAPPVAPPIVEPTPEPVAEVLPEPPIEMEVTPKAVLYEAKPNVPQDISDKIRDPIDVTLRVLVDASGDVMGALMENPGRNKSLAKLADNAAREWKFAETEQEDPRVWLLRFEFTRDGVTASATEQ